MEIFIGLVACTFGLWFAYMSSHIVEEQKRGYSIPLPWETTKKFNKHGVEYRDGDNTQETEMKRRKNPVAKNLNKVNKPTTHADRKKKLASGYVKHKKEEIYEKDYDLQ